MMRILVLLILTLITLGGWGAAALVTLIGTGAIHEILAAIYALIGTVAFCAGAVIGQMQPRA